MSMRKLYWLFFAILLLQIEFAYSQSFDKLYITRHYNHVPLRDVISDLQTAHSLKFFFVDQQIDSAIVTAKINNQVLEQALRIILKNSQLSFYYDQSKIVLFVDENRKATRGSSAKNIYSIRGTVRDSVSNTPIPGASVYIKNLQTGCVSDVNGQFIIRDIPQGVCVIQSSFLGYTIHEQKVVLHSDIDLDISLLEKVTELAAVNVTASALYEICLDEQSSHTLSSDEIFHSPNLARDISRTLRVLPGIAANDFSAKPRIRGGSTDESVFYLDNFEIISPFHFEEFDGVFSVINTDYVSNVKVIPGGFSPAYTDKIAGVVDISTPGILDRNKSSVSVDLINTKLFLTRKINEKLDVQFSARRTYLDLLLFNKNEAIQVDPIYYDLWSKVNYRVNEKNRLAFNFLHSTDYGKAKIREQSHNWIDMTGTRNNDYFWVNWKNTARTNYQQITTAGFQRLAKTSNFSFTNSISDHNVDDRTHNVFVLSHTSFQEIGKRNHLEFGGDVKHFISQLSFDEVRYNTFESTREKTVIDTIDVDSKFTTTLGGLYAQNTFDVSEKLHITAGARLSYFNSVNTSLLLAPRIGASFKLNEKIVLKMGYGIYNQAAYPTETKIYDGEQSPTQQDKQSIHYTASFHYTTKSTGLILNAYYKDNKKLYDDYRYDVFNRLGGGIAILDQSFVTASGYSEGIEAIVRHRYGKGSILTASYAYAVNKIRNSEGIETYRDNDRRHTFLINSLMALKKNWTLSVYSIFYTGEPYTPSAVNFVGESNERQILFFDLGPKNSRRLSSYYSLDLRIDKFWYFRKWNLNIYLNVMNTTSHRNVRNYFWVPWTDDDGEYSASKVEERYLSKIFVSPGISVGF
jgi:hypothetical protein